jgi:hypothetical protein
MRSRWIFIAVALVAIAALAIARTARVFSATVDEPAHLAAGMQWLSTGEYTYDLQHPPLGRVAVALGPWLRGERTTGAPAIYDEGAAILGTADHYVDTLASARHGTLVFFFALALGVWLWARRLGGELCAAIATLLLVANPNVLAHAGLATTDLACTATTILALYAAMQWLETPSMSAALLLGLAAGAAIGSRLSAIAFVGVPMLVFYGLRGWRERRWTLSLAQAGAALGAACLTLLVLYRFDPRPFIAGVNTFFLHGSTGHPTFLLGTPSNRGWWYYFPVALLVKTPPVLLAVTFLSLALVGRMTRERGWTQAAPIAAAATILAISMTVKVDLGVRLVLPIYPLLAIVGGVVAATALDERRRIADRIVFAAALSTMPLSAARAHPDYLAYFNSLAGDHPETILVDSNLDWGQDLYRLRDTLRARGVRDSVRVAYFGTTGLDAAGVPNARHLGLHERTTGWIAASETYLAGEWVGGAYAWLLDHEPVARIGPGMRLWYIPDSATRGQSPP